MKTNLKSKTRNSKRIRNWKTETPRDLLQAIGHPKCLSALGLWAILSLVCNPLCTCRAAPLGTAFSYQGRLDDGSNPANGSYDLRFTIYDSTNTPGNVIAGPITKSATAVSNGLFCVTLDFGSQFNGEARWLEIGVRTNGGSSFTTLTPRQALTPAPYALFAPNAGTAASAAFATSANIANGVATGSVGNTALQANAVTSGKIADGTIVAGDLSPTLRSNTFWRLKGNNAGAGDFVGTTGNQPLEFRVNNQVGLRLEPTTNAVPNVIGGDAGNYVAPGVSAATIGGGGGGGSPQLVAGGGGTVGGGVENEARGMVATVGGGQGNVAGGVGATVSGGAGNTIQTNADFGTIPGGGHNTVAAPNGFAAGWRAKANHRGTFVWADSTDADFASTRSNQFLIRASGGVGIGTNNPSGAALTVAGTVKVTALAVGSSTVVTNLNAELLGGLSASNFWKLGGNAGTTPGAQFLGTKDNEPLEFRVNNQRALRLEPVPDDIYDSNIVNVVAGSQANFVANGVIGATIAGGGAGYLLDSPRINHVDANFGTIGGGQAQRIAADSEYSTIAGGSGDAIETNCDGATIGGGVDNYIGWDPYPNIEPTGNAGLSTIGGGDFNTIASYASFSTIGGGFANSIQTNAEMATIGGGSYNSATAPGAFVGGGGWDGTTGDGNAANGVASVVVGGVGNTASENYTTIGGGFENQIQTNAASAAIGGGAGNTIEMNAGAATIAGGYHNSATAPGAFVGGGGWDGTTGDGNAANGAASVVGGGMADVADANYASIAGGYHNAITPDSAMSTIAGGGWNAISNSATYATIPGGYYNLAGGQFSFAAGRQAQALHDGSFVWSDSTSGAFASTANDQFSIRAHGGVRIESSLGIGLNAANAPLITRGFDLFTSGAYTGLGRWGLFMEPNNLVIGIPNMAGRYFGVWKYDPNGYATLLMTVNQAGDVTIPGVLNSSSDRAVKQDFATVDPQAVLDRVARLPIQTWAYTNSPRVRHIGPMAQDFYTGFRVGADDKHISTVDEGGVALAAIQGLNQKVDSENAALRQELKRRDAENADLEREVGQLKRLVQSLARRHAQ